MKPPRMDQPFVEGIVKTPVGEVPRVMRSLRRADVLGRWRVRWRIGRYDYKVDPGLYALGDPDPDSPILVTANFKLTFDLVRSSLPGLSAWILVLDTRGINVWCAAGKGTFSTDELVARLEFSRLSEIVAHRRVIVPQLGATGVAAHKVRKESGFAVTFGPVRIADLPKFIASGMRATPQMRMPTFTFMERLALTPVELVGSLKPALIALAGFALIGLVTIRPLTLVNLSIGLLQNAGLLLLALLGGTVLTPLLLPWLPFREFAAKGAIVGAFLAAAATIAAGLPLVRALPMFMAMTTVSSYFAMNFTGSTPFTSLSGVEREMRCWIPLQAIAAFFAIAVAITGGFFA